MSLFENKIEIKWRPYQEKAIDDISNYFNSKTTKKAIAVLPTAAGKSWIIAGVAERLDIPLLILQPSKELLEQNVNKFISLGGNPAIYSASAGKKELGKVIYATIGSICKESEWFKGKKFGVIVDEAHLYPPGHDGMFRTFLNETKIKKVQGLTATPFRLKQLSNGYEKYSQLNLLTRMRPKFFSEINHVTQISEMLGKFWSPLKYFNCNTSHELSFSGDQLMVNSTGADYTKASIEKSYEANNMEGKIIEYCNRIIAKRKRLIVFVPDVAFARRLEELVENSVSVHSKMSKKDRANAINEFKSGVSPICFNVNVLSVGFDFPEIDSILVARPTMSLAWYYQALGRGTRIHPDKKDCWIVDLTDNYSKFGRIEDLRIIKAHAFGWGVFGSKGNLVTNWPIHRFGEITIENTDQVQYLR